MEDFDTLGVFLPLAAGVFLPSSVDATETLDAELGVSFESGLGPGGG